MKGSSETKKRHTFPEDASVISRPLLDQQWHPVAKSLSTDFFVSTKALLLWVKWQFRTKPFLMSMTKDPQRHSGL